MYLEPQDLSRKRNETEMVMSVHAAEELDIKNRMLVTPSNHRESFHESNISRHNQRLEKFSQ